MKNILIAVIITGAVSLGFTLIRDKPAARHLKSQNSEKMDFSDKLDEKRLASWD